MASTDQNSEEQEEGAVETLAPEAEALDVESSVVDTEALRAKTELGLFIALALTVLTVVEFFIAVNVDSPAIWLVPFVLAKGVLILEFFMHLSALSRGGDH